MHYVPAGWWERTGQAPPHPQLSDLSAITAPLESGRVDRRVLSAPVSTLFPGPADRAALREINEQLAEATTGHDGLSSFASVDAFGGAGAAADAAEAVDDLGLVGFVLDSARGDLVLGGPESWPVLEIAAECGVPVFVHPVWTSDHERQLAALGREAAVLGRGYQNALALTGSLTSGLYTTFPDLRVVFTALSVGALLTTHPLIDEASQRLGRRPHLYLDTLSFHAPTLRYQIDVLGADRVVVGSDWPFHDDGHRDHVVSVLSSIGLTDDEQDRVLSANFEELFHT